MSTERLYLNVLLSQSVLSEEEKRWLSDYIQRNDTPELRELLLNKFADHLLDDAPGLPAQQSDKMLDQIRRSTYDDLMPARVVPFYRRRGMVAACVLLLAVSAYVLLRPKPQAAGPVVAKVVRTDVEPPKGNRATITLGNGQAVVLDSNGAGMLAMQGEVRIEKSKDGSVVYRGSTLQNVYNTLTNPRGSRPVSLTLSDGTKVWLNSESSLRYPASFAGIERVVEVTGEAYFEVQHVPGSPFRVAVAGKGTVEVLGTHFNINSYADEANTQVTLLEGSIRLTLPAAGAALKQEVNIHPGQQAQYSNVQKDYNAISVRQGVNLDAVMAWKNGFFHFENASLQTVMRQLARWYNIQITYEGNVPPRSFGGELQRDLNLSEVLKLLTKNNIHFTIQNDELIVKP